MIIKFKIWNAMIRAEFTSFSPMFIWYCFCDYYFISVHGVYGKLAYRTYCEPQFSKVFIGLSSQITTIHTTENIFAEKFVSFDPVIFFVFLPRSVVRPWKSLSVSFFFCSFFEEIWIGFAQHMNFLSSDAIWKVLKNISYSNLVWLGLARLPLSMNRSDERK